MAGISSKAANSLENKKKFVEQELDEALGLEWYQFKARDHDPQIGRFWQIDPLTDNFPYNSTYAYAENRPIDGIDLEGKEFWRTVGNILTDPANPPAHIAIYIAQKKAEYQGSIDATARLATGTSERPSTPAPAAIQKVQSTINKMNDINKAAQPYLDVLEITNTLGSLVPISEAGLIAASSKSILSQGLKLNIYGEGEVKGFLDVAVNPAYANGRPLTSSIASGGVKSIVINNSPLYEKELAEISRLTFSGSTITYSAPTGTKFFTSLSEHLSGTAVLTNSTNSTISGVEMQTVTYKIK